MQKIKKANTIKNKKKTIVDKVETELDVHFNSVWSSGISPWLFSGKNDAIVLRKKELLTPIISKIDSVLDIGCGGGEFLNFICDGQSKKSYKVGVDIATNAIKNADKLGIYNELYISNIDDLKCFNKGTEKLDLVLLNEVLYYQVDYMKTLKIIEPMVSKYLFISLAMGDNFFNNNDLLDIKAFFESDYVLLSETKIDYTRFKIPLRFGKYIMKKVSQTHKNILIFKCLK